MENGEYQRSEKLINKLLREEDPISFRFAEYAGQIAIIDLMSDKIRESAGRGDQELAFGYLKVSQLAAERASDCYINPDIRNYNTVGSDLEKSWEEGLAEHAFDMHLNNLKLLLNSLLGKGYVGSMGAVA